MASPRKCTSKNNNSILHYVVLAVIIVAIMYLLLLAKSLQRKKASSWISHNTTWLQQGRDKPWVGFDRVYFLTLPKRESYVRDVTKQLGIEESAWLLRAFSYKEINPELFENKILYYREAINQLKKNNTMGAAGCYLSHYTALKHCYESSDVNTCVIFEDDVHLVDERYLQKINAFMDEISTQKKDWHLLYLDFHRESMNSLTFDDTVAVPLTGCFGGHAYIVNKRGAKLLLDNMLPMRLQFDSVLRSLVQHKILRAYGINGQKKIFAQNRSLHSNICNNYRSDEPKFSYLDFELDTAYKPKVIQIGLHHCDSSTIQNFLHNAGMKVLPFRDETFIDDVFHRKINNKKLISRIFKHYNYFDFSEIFDADSNVYFLSSQLQRLVAENPEAVYILNTRDKDKWIRSVFQDVSNPYLKSLYTQLNHEQVKERLAKDWEQYHDNAHQLFKDNKSKILIYDVDIDSPNKIAEFLSDIYKIDIEVYTRPE